jgi:hypothetical protein
VLSQEPLVKSEDELFGNPPRFLLHFARSRRAFLYRLRNPSAILMASPKLGS